MKKLLTFLMLSVAFFAYGDIGQVNRSAQEDITGSIISGTIDKYFIKVRNQSGSTIPDGRITVLDVSNDDGYSVTTSATVVGNVPHCVMAESCVDDGMCLCQTWGLKTNVAFDVTNDISSAGGFVFISESNAGYVQANTIAEQATGDVVLGTFYESNTASEDAKIFIRLRN